MTPPSNPGSGRGPSGRPSRGSGQGRPGGEPRKAGVRGPMPRPSVPRPRVPNSRALAQKRTSPISTFGGLAVVAVLLLAGLGYGYATGSQAKTTVDDKAIRQLPVSSATVVCQGQQGAGADTTTTTATFSPGGTSSAATDSSSFAYIDGSAYKGLSKLPAAGARGDSGPASAVLTKPFGVSQLFAPVPLVAQATGAHAPGFSAAEKIRSDTGNLRGLADTQCTSPSTDFWFAGVSLGPDRQSMLFLANPDPQPASVNLAFYGPDGPVDTNGASQQIIVGAHGFQQLMLGSFPSPQILDPTVASVHVVATSGRVSAVVEDTDEAKTGSKTGLGIDFIPSQTPAAPAQAQQVIPGIPAPNGVKDQKVTVQLVLTAVGTQDASVDTLQWTGASSFKIAAPTAAPPDGTVKRDLPIKVPLGKTVVVDLSDVPSGEEAGAVTLTNSGGALLSGVRIVAAAAKGTLTDTAYLAPSANLAGTESIVTDNHAGGVGKSFLLLSDLGGKGATVKVTTVPTGGQGTTVPVSLQPNQTLIYPLTATGDFTTVVDVPAGGDEVYAAREMWDNPAKGGVQISEQVLQPARITAAVPPVAVDLSGAVKRQPGGTPASSGDGS
jgi:hypothetical protein